MKGDTKSLDFSLRLPLDPLKDDSEKSGHDGNVLGGPWDLVTT